MTNPDRIRTLIVRTAEELERAGFGDSEASPQKTHERYVARIGQELGADDEDAARLLSALAQAAVAIAVTGSSPQEVAAYSFVQGLAFARLRVELDEEALS